MRSIVADRPKPLSPRASRVIKAHRVTGNQRPKVPKGVAWRTLTTKLILDNMACPILHAASGSSAPTRRRTGVVEAHHKGRGERGVRPAADDSRRGADDELPVVCVAHERATAGDRR